MEFTSEEKQIQEEACSYIQAHKDRLVDEYILSKSPLKIGFITIFMAGSPGAGKTEFSQRYLPLLFRGLSEKVLKLLSEKGIDTSSVKTLFVRVDVDEIRSFLPQYRKTDPQMGIKGNAHVIQKAANKGLEIVRNYCLRNNISFLHDGTFGNYDTMREIVKKSIGVGREVQIYYLYIDPVAAWKFTQAREFLEGRNIIKEKFIQQYFNSKENVDRIKKEFGDNVKVHCVLKDADNRVIDIALNVESIDKYLELGYSRGQIQRYSEKDLSAVIT